VVIFLLACRIGDPTTLVDELRVMGLRQQPAEISIDDLFIPNASPPLIEAWVARPSEQQIDLLLWSCTNFGEGCLEKEVFQDSPEEWIDLSEDIGTYISRPLPLSPLPLGFVPELTAEDQPFAGTLIWALACQQGSCPLIEEIKSGSIDLEQLANPLTLMKSLPVEEASLSFRSLYFSNRPEEERIKHPELEPNFGGTPNLALDNYVELGFSYQTNQIPTEDAQIYGYTTLGSFAPNEDINNKLIKDSGDLSLRWFTPTTEEWELLLEESESEPESEALPFSSIGAEPLDEAAFFIFLEDGYGGLGVWQGSGYLLSSASTSPE
jgi:hypothetical protein